VAEPCQHRAEILVFGRLRASERFCHRQARHQSSQSIPFCHKIPQQETNTEPTNNNMTIRNTSTTANAEPEFSITPIYEHEETNHGTSSYSSGGAVAYAEPTAPLAPSSTATALTTGQSFRRQDQLITIPSSNVLLDTTPSKNTTFRKTTTRPVAVTAVRDENNHNQQSRYIRKHGMRINRKNAHLPEPVLRFKQKRKQRTVAATWTGGIVGLVTLGPVGAAIGAGGAYAAAKSVGKQRERKMEKRYNNAVAQAPEVRATPVTASFSRGEVV